MSRKKKAEVIIPDPPKLDPESAAAIADADVSFPLGIAVGDVPCSVCGASRLMLAPHEPCPVCGKQLEDTP